MEQCSGLAQHRKAQAQLGLRPPTDVRWQRALPQMEEKTPTESYNPEGACWQPAGGTRQEGHPQYSLLITMLPYRVKHAFFLNTHMHTCTHTDKQLVKCNMKYLWNNHSLLMRLGGV